MSLAQRIINKHGLTQADLGRAVYGYDDKDTARKAGWRLVHSDTCKNAVHLTLKRLDDGTLDPHEEKHRTL